MAPKLSMQQKLLIVGAGAQARYVINTVSLTHQAEIVGLIDTFDNSSMRGREVGGCKILGGLSELENFSTEEGLLFVLAVAKLDQKREIAAQLESRGCKFAAIVHPTVVISRGVEIGEGSIINAGVICEDSVRIGRHVIVHAGSVLEHDNVVEDFVNIGPGVKTGGRVRFGSGAVVYTGATLIPDVVVGPNSIVGAGAVVLAAVAAGSVVAGVPARQLPPARRDGNISHG